MGTWDVVVVGAGPAGVTAARAIARRGWEVCLIDKAIFPRDKCCAAWISAHVTERFPWTRPLIDEASAVPFYGIAFHHPDREQSVSYFQPEPMGHLAVRRDWDAALFCSVQGTSLEVRQDCRFLGLERKGRRVVVRTNRGSFETRFVVGADGVNSQVRKAAGLNRGWSARACCICGNADVPANRDWIEKHFGPRRAIHIFPAFQSASGYAWVFPKAEHVCVGVGFRPTHGTSVQRFMVAAMDRARRQGLLPRSTRPDEIDYALDPTGLATRLARLADERVALAGDAGGFVSPSTGEGIFPAMLSGRIAADVIHRALRHARTIDVQRHASRCRYEFQAWFRNGERSRATRGGVRAIFRWRIAAHVAARMYAFGETPSLASLLRSFANRGRVARSGARQALDT